MLQCVAVCVAVCATVCLHMNVAVCLPINKTYIIGRLNVLQCVLQCVL